MEIQVWRAGENFNTWTVVNKENEIVLETKYGNTIHIVENGDGSFTITSTDNMLISPCKVSGELGFNLRLEY